LQQLSSGSKINSGADDAAGLSLVNGLQANQSALMQSETNATEGVGLLEVADGALSQVTSLLDRAITLATEASNGTLNATQDAAANQEYQSILAEVNNIGSTTTYNQQQVFSGNVVAIYTGDSSIAGSSVDDLNIRTLSSSSIGDTNGAMTYSSGASNVFIDLSNGGHNASVSDSLNASGTTTVNVTYSTKGAGGAATQATAAITVGTGTGYANTVNGLIGAINQAGLGLTATFGTAALAGTAAAATASAANNGGGSESDTGIIISSAGIGAGTNGAGVVGALSLAAGDTLGGTLTIVGSDGENHNFTLGTANSTDTLASLEATINAAGDGVTATLNQAGTLLTFTTVDPKVTVAATNLTENSAATSATITIAGSGLGSLTVGAATDTLTGTLNLTEGADGLNKQSVLTLGTTGSTDTLANLASTINSGSYGITATLNQAGTVLTFTKMTGDLGTPGVAGSNVTDVGTPLVITGGTLGSLTLASAGDTLASGTLDITSGITGAAVTPITLGTAGHTDNLANLAATINAGGYGITATVDATGTILTFTQTSGTHTAAIGGTGVDTTYTTTPDAVVVATTVGAITVSGSGDTVSVGTAGSGLVLTGNAAGTLGTLTVVNSASAANAEAATLAGTLNLTDSAGGAHALNLATGNGGGAFTLASLATYLNSGLGSTWGITATNNISAAGTLDTANIVFTTASPTAKVNVSAGLTGAGAGVDTVTAATVATTTLDLGTTPLSLTALKNAVNADTAVDGITATLNAAKTTLTFSAAPGTTGATTSITPLQTLTDTIAAVTHTSASTFKQSATLGSLTATNSNDTLTGTFNITEGVDNKATPSSLSFTNETLTQIMNSINNGGYGITATLNAAGNGVAAGTVLSFNESASNAGTATITNNGVVADTAVAVNQPSLGVVAGTGLGTLTTATPTDILSGTLEVTNTSGVSSSYTFTGQTLQEIASSFNQPPNGANNTSGISATVNSVVQNGHAIGTVLTFTGTGSNAVSGVGIADFTPASTTNQLVATGTILNTLTVANSADYVGGDFDITSGLTGVLSSAVAIAGNQTLLQIANDFNGVGGAPQLALDAYGITATLSNNNTVLTFSETQGDVDIANITDDVGTPLSDTTPASSSTTGIFSSTPTLANTLTVAASSDTLAGTLAVQEGADTNHTSSMYNLAGQTLAQIAAAFNTGAEKNLGITAILNGAGTTLTFLQSPGDAGTADVTDATKLVDQTGSTGNAVTVATGTMLNTLIVNKGSDLLGGALNLTSGLSGAITTIALGTIGTTDTVAHLIATINGGGYGITASVNAAGNQITFAQNNGDGFTPGVSGTGITDSEAIGVTASSGLGTLTVNSASDTLSGTLSGVEGDGVTPFTITLGTPGATDTLQDLAHTVNVVDAAYGVTASLNQAGTVLSFTATAGDTGAPALGNLGLITDTTPTGVTPISLIDVPTEGADSTALGSLSIPSTDTLSGGLTIGQNTISIGSTDNTAATLVAAINKGDYGITASYNSANDALTFFSPNPSLTVNTSNLQESVLNSASPAPVGPLTGTPSTASGYYSIGISGNITDTSTAIMGQNSTTYGGTSNVGIVSDSDGAGGTATMGYTDSAGISLNGTDLLNQADAVTVLNQLNVAITDVAAQDGYIGAQINTMNSVSQVMNTQQENVVSAQNAIQATDYASATSNMSKYEILSQTGIAALAQANTVQQEVTKLLQ
jgi:flagellin